MGLTNSKIPEESMAVFVKSGDILILSEQTENFKSIYYILYSLKKKYYINGLIYEFDGLINLLKYILNKSRLNDLYGFNLIYKKNVFYLYNNNKLIYDISLYYIDIDILFKQIENILLLLFKTFNIHLEDISDILEIEEIKYNYVKYFDSISLLRRKMVKIEN